MFQIDAGSRQPIYEQLMLEIIRLKALDVLQPDTQLPSVRSLATQLGINPNTVQKAYQILETKGILYSISGKGSFISGSSQAEAKLREEAQAKLQSALTEAAAAGVTKGQALALIETIYQEGSDHA